jgi:hypothetical protein
MFGANGDCTVQPESLERGILEQWLRNYLLLCTIVFLLYSTMYLAEALKPEIPLAFVRRRFCRRSRC